MAPKQTATDFHQSYMKDNSEPGPFNVYKKELCEVTSVPHTRRDFYKISLVTRGEGILSYTDKAFHIKNNVITFSNPMIPYSWEPLSSEHAGYFCLFTEDFINSHLKADSLAESPLFKVNGNHVFSLDEPTMNFLCGIFERMFIEMQSNYANKYDLLRSYVQIIIHEALKIDKPSAEYTQGTSSARISDLFLALLERQFPIASQQDTLPLKNANEYAYQLSVHTNHLNRALKEITGKTTTELIAERIIKEAKALLAHSNWDISNIGYCLGFEHSSNFNIFFKKHTGQTPNSFRREPVAIS